MLFIFFFQGRVNIRDFLKWHRTTFYILYPINFIMLEIRIVMTVMIMTTIIMIMMTMRLVMMVVKMIMSASLERCQQMIFSMLATINVFIQAFALFIPIQSTTDTYNHDFVSTSFIYPFSTCYNPLPSKK